MLIKWPIRFISKPHSANTHSVLRSVLITSWSGCKLVKKSYLPKWQVNIFFYLPNEKFTSQNSFSQKVMYFYLRNKKHKHLCTQNTYKWNVSPPLIQKTLRHHQIQNQNRRNSPPQSILPHICLNFFTRQSDG